METDQGTTWSLTSTSHSRSDLLNARSRSRKIRVPSASLSSSPFFLLLRFPTAFSLFLLFQQSLGSKRHFPPVRVCSSTDSEHSPPSAFQRSLFNSFFSSYQFSLAFETHQWLLETRFSSSDEGRKMQMLCYEGEVAEASRFVSMLSLPGFE